MAALQPRDEAFRRALNGIAARLPVPLPARDIRVDLLGGEALELDRSLAQFLAQRPVRRAQGDGGQDGVAAARQQFETAARGRLVLGLGKDAAPGGDHRVSGEDMGRVARRGQRLFARHAAGIIARQFRLERRLVDIGGRDRVRCHPQPREQFAAARAGGSEDQARRGHRAGCHDRIIAAPDRRGPA